MSSVLARLFVVASLSFTTACASEASNSSDVWEKAFGQSMWQSPAPIPEAE